MWPASCPRAPTWTPPLYSVAIAPSLASRSCIVKPDHGYPKYTLAPPRRSHQCRPQSIPNPLHELDLAYTSGAWIRETPRGHLTCWAVNPTDTLQCLPSRVSRNVRPEKFQFLEKRQNRNFGYTIVISVKNPKFIL